MNPNIGKEIAFVSARGEKQLVYFHLPVFLALVVNILCFVYTLSRVFKTQRSKNDKITIVTIRYI